jgi:hypothetical protein
MHRTTRIVASTLAVAALGVAGAHSGANATTGTDPCVHGSVTPSSGHYHGVEFLSEWTIQGDHTHQYRHKTGSTTHKRERICELGSIEHPQTS